MKIEDIKINTKDINRYEHKGYPGGLSEVDAGAGKGSFGAGIHTKDMYKYNKYERSRMEMDLRGSEMLTGQEHLYSRYSAGVFDGMALSDQFLGEYYSTVSTSNVTKNIKLTKIILKKSKSCIICINCTFNFEHNMLWLYLLAEIRPCRTAIRAEGCFAGL